MSPQLDRFSQKSDYLWNFRCPVCGDSKKNKLKSRGYVYRRKADLFFTCHNCGTSMSFGHFLKTVNHNLYDEYRLEKFKNDHPEIVETPDYSVAKTTPDFTTTIHLPRIADLPNEHAAKRLLFSRKVPAERYKELYYAHNFASFVKELVPSYNKNLKNDDARIVIPFYDEKNILLGVQGREIQKTGVKYITIKLRDENRKVFGLDKVDYGKKIYVVEGPIDSMFLQNALATMDAQLYKVISSVGDYDYVFIFDNEPRNPQICNHMAKTIAMGANIVVWPQYIEQKDINDMILAGYTSSDIQDIIDKHTYTDLKAKMEFGKWKRV
jgi:transcription elongation factor Elf1